MASAKPDSGLEPGYNGSDAAIDLPKPVEPCSICQRLVDFLRSSCTREEPNADSDLDSDSETRSACVLVIWSAIQQNDGCPTCQKVVKTLSDLGASDSCTEDAYIRVTQPWDGHFTIKLCRDCQDEDKNIVLSLSTLGDNTPWAGYFSGVLVDASWVDIGRIEQWLAQCNSLHKGVCSDIPGITGIKLPDILYLVDVEDQCITVAEKIPSYIALSYVWAHASNQCELTKENLAFMTQPGSLTSDHMRPRISGTIRAAMKLCQLIAVRFLWIDRLCIIQNDFLRKAECIDAMGGIYSHSYLTLAVADSDHSNSGLRGMKDVTKPRHLFQNVYTFHASPHSVTAFMIYKQPPTVYDDRGWTFQEQMLAKQVLKFTDSGMHWICQSCDRREQRVDCKSSLSGFNFGDRNLKYLYSLWPDVKLWDNILQNYLKRDLTYEDDILRAFTGITKILSGSFPGGFHFGLPELFFDAALLWRPANSLERRTSDTGVALPSWSWCGWKGKIRSGINAFGTEHIRSDPIIKGERGRQIIMFPWKFPWKKTTVDQRKTTDVYNLWHLFRDDVPPPRRFDPAKPLPPGWSLKQPAQGNAYFTHHAALNYTFYYPLPTPCDRGDLPRETWGPVLRFVIIQVFLYIGKPLCFLDEEKEDEDDDASDRFGMFSLVDSENMWVGVLHVNIEPTDSSRILGESCELILLSFRPHLTYIDEANDLELLREHLPELASDVAENIPTGGLYEFVNVMWIEREEDMAYRKGIGMIFQGDGNGRCGTIVLLG